MAKYLSREWLELGKQAVNRNVDFRKIAKDMNLTIYHVIEGVPERGTIYFWSTFKEGECIEVKLGRKEAADFTLTAPFTIWKSIHAGRLEITQAVLEKMLRVEGKPIKGIKILKLAPLMNKIIAGIETDFNI
jgi:hypothetical protein